MTVPSLNLRPGSLYYMKKKRISSQRLEDTKKHKEKEEEIEKTIINFLQY
jgi:hypothetical protein